MTEIVLPPVTPPAADAPRALSELERRRLAALLAEAKKRADYKFNRYFPDCKPECVPGSPRKEDHVGLCRCLYVKHVAFMESGREFNERLFMAGNRIGKTDAAAFELTAHLTGRYPDWWRGRRFDKPIRAWVAGETMETTRNIVQVALLGPFKDVPSREWTGLVPTHLIREFPTRKSGGVPNCIDAFEVKHVSGVYSSVAFKSYDQGERGFQGTEQDVIWLDEQCPPEIYNECLMRILTTDGMIMTTFTPLEGLTEFIQHYLASAVMPDTDGALKAANDVFWPADRIE